MWNPDIGAKFTGAGKCAKSKHLGAQVREISCGLAATCVRRFAPFSNYLVFYLRCTYLAADFIPFFVFTYLTTAARLRMRC